MNKLPNGKDPEGREFVDSIESATLEVAAEEDGYSLLRWLWYEDKWVLCGMRRMAFTIGLFYGIDETGYIGRWCFPNLMDATVIYATLEEIPDDLVIGGNWIKHKGYIEFSNPNSLKEL
jgi:hypothetical protein